MKKKISPLKKVLEYIFEHEQESFEELVYEKNYFMRDILKADHIYVEALRVFYKDENKVRSTIKNMIETLMDE